MRLFRLIVLALCTLTSCALPRAPIPGVYLETRPNAVLLTSRELILYSDGHARYLVHSDNMSSSREGRGTYRLRGRRLELLLSGLADSAAIRSTSAPLPATTRQLRFYVSGLTPAGKSVPLAGLTVLVSSAAYGTAINLGAPTDSAGYVELPWRPAEQPQLIEIKGIGWRTWQHHWPSSPTAFHIQLPPHPYEAYTPGTRKLFRVLAVTPQRLVLRQGPDTLTLVRQP